MKLTDFLDADEKAEGATQTAAPNTNGDAPRFVTIHDGEGPFDKLDKIADWDDIFVYGANYTKLDRAPDSKTLVAYKRPGGESDYSVKILKDNPHVVVVHSDMCGLPTGGNQKLTKGRVCAEWYHNHDERAAATAMLKGEANYLPTHIQQALKGPDRLAGFNITETTAETITGNSEPPTEGAFLKAVYTEVWKTKVRSRAREVIAEEEARKVRFPEFVRLDEFLARDDDGPKQLIRGLWNTDTPVLMAAQYKAGKTTIRDNVVKALVDGYDFLDRFQVNQITEGTIVILDLELSETMMREWLKDQNIKTQERVVVVPMRGMGASLNLMLPAVRQQWASRLQQWNCQVLILDCLRPRAGRTRAV
jgi:hypothetical protein